MVCRCISLEAVVVALFLSIDLACLGLERPSLNDWVLFKCVLLSDDTVFVNSDRELRNRA